MGTEEIGYSYVDDQGDEEIYWFPAEEIYDADTGAIEYVPLSNYRKGRVFPCGDAAHVHSPAAGERAPDVSLAGKEKLRLHEILGNGRFAVLSAGTSRVTLPASLDTIAVAVEASANPDYESGHTYLIRPDAYVMLSCRDGDTAPILQALERVANG